MVFSFSERRRKNSFDSRNRKRIEKKMMIKLLVGTQFLQIRLKK